MGNIKWVRVVLVSALVFVLDQVTKLLVLKKVQPGELIPVLEGYFNITLTFNPGIAFGLFASMDPKIRAMLLSATIALALCIVVVLLVREYRNDWLAHLALALVVGGAIGNIVDRLRFGSVVDFLDFHWGRYHWPAFNVADSAICIAVIFLLLRQTILRVDIEKNEPVVRE